MGQNVLTLNTLNTFAPPRLDPAAFQRVMIDGYAPAVAYAYLRPTAPPKRGDKVRITIDGYVRDVTDNVITVVDKRGPFTDDAKVIAFGPLKHDAINVRVVERAPAEPMVGDTITGAVLRATPWRRGTIIRRSDHGQYGDGTRYVLLGSGEWQNLDNTARRGFASFGSERRFVVEYAPGKQNRIDAPIDYTTTNGKATA